MLWLATAAEHAANTRHSDGLGMKADAHQASSVPMASIMSALWLGDLTAADGAGR